jgi:HTH-type transcriptional regulator/antitoxin HipB
MQIRRPAELGAFIAATRRARGLSQDELARSLGVSRVWLGQVERGKATPRLDLVLRVLNELEITLAVYTQHEAPFAEATQAPPTAAIDIDAIADTGLPPQPAPQGRAPRRRAR